MDSLGLWYGNKILLDDEESLEFKLCVDNCTMDATNIVVYCINDCFRFSPGSVVVCVFGVLQGGDTYIVNTS